MTNTTKIQEAKQNLEKKRLALVKAIEVQSQLDSVERNLSYLSRGAQLELNTFSASDIASAARQYSQAIQELTSTQSRAYNVDAFPHTFALTKGAK